jgi:hypothetical protein
MADLNQEKNKKNIEKLNFFYKKIGNTFLKKKN